MASKVEQRLIEREEARRAALEHKRKQREDEKKDSETQEYFYSQFTRQKQEIEEMLNSVELHGQDVKEHFEQIAQRLQLLQKLLSDSSLFLPGYNLRSSQQTIAELKQLVQSKQDELLPKKKFTFNTRKKTTSQKEAEKGPDNETKESTTTDEPITKESITTALLTNTVDIKDMTSSKIPLSPANGCDINLSNLESCSVIITGTPGTVHMSKIRNTTVLCGPVQRSVFIEDCSKCNIVVSCQQLRVHGTTDTDFYLHITSKAIIEDSKSLRFAPYNWNYPQLEFHYQNSGLSTEVNNWNQVDDFNWLTSKEHSPNWSLIPETDRTTSWT